MKVIMDLHTHTMASGHGYSTLKENIDAAREAGLKYLGLSEHGPAMPGGPHVFFFSNYKVIPRQYGELKLLCGIEANIMDYEGSLDIDEALQEKMDYIISSMHVPCVKPGSREENTRASVNAIKNPFVKILGHPDDSRFPLDYDVLVQAAAEEGVALEVNNSSLHPLSPRKGGRENIAVMLEACKKYDVPVLLGSDSHVCCDIGRFDASFQMLDEVGFPYELILNGNSENIRRIIRQ